MQFFARTHFNAGIERKKKDYQERYEAKPGEEMDANAIESLAIMNVAKIWISWRPKLYFQCFTIKE